MIDAGIDALNPAAFNHAPCGIFTIGEDGNITLANAYCYALLEFSPGELEGRNVATILTIAGRIFYQTHFYPTIKLHKKADEIFLHLQTKAGKTVPVVLNAAVISSGTGNSIICSFIQVFNRGKYEAEILSAKKNAEDSLRKNELLEEVRRELEQQQKELDKQIKMLSFQNNELLQLGSVITHDLQEPVRKLILYSNEFMQGNLDDRKKERAMGVIKKSSEKVKNLLLNLQEYLSLTTHSEDKRQVNLYDIVSGELCRLQAEFPHIHLDAHLNPLPEISGIQNQLQTLFYQLLRNCFVHGQSGNHVVITIEAVLLKENLFNFLQDKYSYIDVVRIKISDEGPGFENRYRHYIFDFLKKLDIREQGPGLGLTFCRKIVENHNGSIEADGTVGGGATFTIILPLNDA